MLEGTRFSRPLREGPAGVVDPMKEDLMKKASSRKPQTTANSVDQYLARVPQPARGTLNKVRAAIRSVVPEEATETISYGIPMFKYKGLLFGYAAFSKHCSLFPTSMAVIKTFKKELKAFETSKGTIRFPQDKPLPAALVKKMVKARLAEKERNADPGKSSFLGAGFRQQDSTPGRGFRRGRTSLA
jgi:uncharacterized protein YdhG (YjbR/CyaY superfamily)